MTYVYLCRSALISQLLHHTYYDRSVLRRGWEGLLGLELYDPASNSGMSLNEELVKDGLLVAVRSPLQQRGLLVPPMPQKKSRQVVFLPG